MANVYTIAHPLIKISISTKFYHLLNFIIFTDPDGVLNLICMKYYEIGINL